MKNKVPLWFKVVYVLSVTITFWAFLPSSIENKVISNGKTVKMDKEVYNAIPKSLIETFVGELTGYGPDCYGCSGITSSGYNVKSGNIYFNDRTYGEVRVLAADATFTFGTVIRITAPNIYADSFLAVVLDRGKAIYGHKFDLLFESEQATRFVGRQRDVKFEILRNGW